MNVIIKDAIAGVILPKDFILENDKSLRKFKDIPGNATLIEFWSPQQERYLPVSTLNEVVFSAAPILNQVGRWFNAELVDEGCKVCFIKYSYSLEGKEINMIEVGSPYWLYMKELEEEDEDSEYDDDDDE